MQQLTMAEFVDAFTEVAADTDYSAKPSLQGVSRFDIQAAAAALWRESIRRGWGRETVFASLDSTIVLHALGAQVKRYDDENELVSTEFEEYWDTTDTFDFPTGLRQEMQEIIARRFLKGKEEEGMVTVNNRNGIWLFRFSENL